ncbi:MAG: hypothetical protein JXQ73_30130 [Phycisphaerae bacterium]|nr:hypothetical protein [Phycisphaerae bacterium]
MRRLTSLACLWMFLLAFTVGIEGCVVAPGDEPNDPNVTERTYDVDTLGVPRFVDHDFTQLEKIVQISRFRSGYGHDYSDPTESCRSMKHYYQPAAEYRRNEEIEVRAPVSGTIERIFDEQHGSSEGLTNKQVHIRPDNWPAFHFALFHVDLVDESIVQGKHVEAGGLIGHARMYYPDLDAYANDFDIAVRVDTPTGWRYVSYFETMTDRLFGDYVARGAVSRTDFIISKEDRDADPLTCDGDGRFAGVGSLVNWFALD